MNQVNKRISPAPAPKNFPSLSLSFQNIPRSPQERHQEEISRLKRKPRSSRLHQASAGDTPRTVPTSRYPRLSKPDPKAAWRAKSPIGRRPQANLRRRPNPPAVDNNPKTTALCQADRLILAAKDGVKGLWPMKYRLATRTSQPSPISPAAKDALFGLKAAPHTRSRPWLRKLPASRPAVLKDHLLLHKVPR
jgi:hypothetical protein